MKVTAGEFGVKVAYRESGKQYGSSGGEADTGLYPFEEVDIAAGEEFVLPEGARLVFVRELTPCVDLADISDYIGGGSE
jgi:hypothetical protein